MRVHSFQVKRLRNKMLSFQLVEGLQSQLACTGHKMGERSVLKKVLSARDYDSNVLDIHQPIKEREAVCIGPLNIVDEQDNRLGKSGGSQEAYCSTRAERASAVTFKLVRSEIFLSFCSRLTQARDRCL